VEETIRKAGVIRARVQARIAEIMRAGAERAEVTVEQVVRELKLIGFSDIRKVVSWRNRPDPPLSNRRAGTCHNAGWLGASWPRELLRPDRRG
jgi:hypothetical protein